MISATPNGFPLKILRRHPLLFGVVIQRASRFSVAYAIAFSTMPSLSKFGVFKEPRMVIQSEYYSHSSCCKPSLSAEKGLNRSYEYKF